MTRLTACAAEGFASEFLSELRSRQRGRRSLLQPLRRRDAQAHLRRLRHGQRPAGPALRRVWRAAARDRSGTRTRSCAAGRPDGAHGQAGRTRCTAAALAGSRGASGRAARLSPHCASARLAPDPGNGGTCVRTTGRTTGRAAGRAPGRSTGRRCDHSAVAASCRCADPGTPTRLGPGCGTCAGTQPAVDLPRGARGTTRRGPRLMARCGSAHGADARVGRRSLAAAGCGRRRSLHRRACPRAGRVGPSVARSGGAVAIRCGHLDGGVDHGATASAGRPVRCATGPVGSAPFPGRGRHRPPAGQRPRRPPREAPALCDRRRGGGRRHPGGWRLDALAAFHAAAPVRQPAGAAARQRAAGSAGARGGGRPRAADRACAHSAARCAADPGAWNSSRPGRHDAKQPRRGPRRRRRPGCRGRRRTGSGRPPAGHTAAAGACRGIGGPP